MTLDVRTESDLHSAKLMVETLLNTIKTAMTHQQHFIYIIIGRRDVPRATATWTWGFMFPRNSSENMMLG